MTDIRVVGSADFGSECLRALLESVASTRDPVVGLPTGNTPVALFEKLRAEVQASRIDISSWRPFAIDEYGGPRTHPCSNRAFFARYWDTIPGARPVEQLDPEAADLAAECTRMSSALADAGGLSVAILGIGMNGHLAFNEPGAARHSTVRNVQLHDASMASARACWGDETPTWGLTLGLAELLGALKVLVFANGPAKAEIVARALEGPPSLDCPASLTAPLDNAVWVLDEAAAGLLNL